MQKMPLILGTLLGFALATSIASAQPTPEDIATARVLGQDGMEALEKKDFATAADLFSRADALYHAPTLALGLARAHVGLGKLVAAYEAYNRVVREGLPAGTSSPILVKAIEDAKREMPALEARLPSVVITVSGPANTTVTLDGSAVPRAALGVKRFVDPGEHTVRASSDGHLPVEMKFIAIEGEAATAPLTLAPAPSPAEVPRSSSLPAPRRAATAATPARVEANGGSFQRTLGFLSLGAGIGAVGLGAAMGGVALADDAELRERCPEGQCSSDEISRTEGFERMRWLGIGSLAAGGALAAAGTTLVLTSDKEAPASPRRAIGTSLLGAGIAGLALGATTGALSLDVSSDLDGCDETTCAPSQQGSLESASNLRTLSFVGLGVGVASLGAGITLLATDSPPASTGAIPAKATAGVRVTPWIGPTGGGVRGAF